MGFIWRNNDLDTMQARFRAIPQELEEEAERLVQGAIEEGAEAMEMVIATSGTGWKDRQGRVETGKMLDHVKEFGTERDGNRVEGKFGWDDPENYFIYQEQGFRHWISGKDVVPMHALLTGFVAAREHVIRGLGRMLRK